jgi:iron(III) transport system ATP-binding protein
MMAAMVETVVGDSHEEAAGAGPERVAVEGITRRFGALAAVREVSFALKAGEIVCLLGPSGCGKTTLLRIVAGLERQDAGRVLIDGVEVSGPARFVAPEHRGVGLVFQDYALFPHLTVLGNVTFGLTPEGAAVGEGAGRRALERVGLAHLSQAWPHTLSGGEQQRAALARAIAPRPKVLLMDEPFSNLDRSLRESVRDDAWAILKSSEASSILVTHDPEEAMLVADRIALMRAGRLVQVGTPDELYRHPADAAAARFFSHVNEFAGRVEAGTVATPLGRLAAPGRGERQLVQVLVRDRGVRVVTPGKGAAARIEWVRFAGEVTRIAAVIAADGVRVRLRAPGRTKHRVGDEIGLVVDPDLVHVFPADPI